MSSLLLAVLACGPSSQPASPPTEGTYPPVEQPRGASVAVYPLHTRLESATYALADSNLPASFGADATFTVELSQVKRKRRASFPVPFQLNPDARTRFGKDLSVVVDGQPFSYAPLGGGGNTWRLHKNDIVINVRATHKTATLTYAGADRLVSDRVVSASGRTPAEFVQRSLTLKGRTIPGIMLPSPSTATWSIAVPSSNPRFRATVSLMPGVVADAISDGATIEIVVDDAGKETVIAQHAIDEIAFEEIEAELGAFAGRTVSVSLRTVVRGTPDHDYVFIGAPTVWGVPDQEVRRVVVIGLDTTRPTSMGFYGYPKNSTPELDRIAGQSAVAMNAWTPAPRTRPSFRSATTGRYPLLAVGAMNIGEVFQANGFATAGFVANIHLQPRFDFHEGFDVWAYDGLADADQQVDRALGWFNANVDRDTYMFLHFMDPHLAYDAPEPFRNQFVTDPAPNVPRGFSRWQVTRWEREGVLTDRRKAHIRGLQDGEMRFMSKEIGRLVDALDRLPGKTTIVIHSDHGEEFFEHGGFEHNHTLYDEVTRAVLMVRPPGGTLGGPVRMEQNATLADIAPTVYGLVGFEALPPTDGIDLVPYAKGAPTTPRPIGIGHLRYGLDRYGVVHDGHKYIVETGTGREELYDLKTDPGEQQNLAASRDLTAWRKALLEAHPELEGGWGWRVDVVGQVPPFTLTAEGVASVGILEPDLQSPSRPNLAWGEAPSRGADSVGTVSQVAEGVRFVPNGASGQLWVRFPGEVPSPTTLVVNGETRTLTADGEAWSERLSTGGRVSVRPSMVLVPPPGEAARMSTLTGSVEDASEDETCRLCELGYISGDACSGC